MIYEALVVGGPLNGQRLACRSQSYEQVIQTETPLLFYNTAANKIESEPAFDRFYYSFGPIYLDHNNELNVWTPKGQSRLETLRKLLEHYKP